MKKNKEIPVDIDALIAIIDSRPSTATKTETEMLMEAGPNEPEDANYFLDRLRDVVIDSIEALSEQDRFIIEAIHYEGISYEQLGKRMGISNVHAWRLGKTAVGRLKDNLLQHELIRNYLGD